MKADAIVEKILIDARTASANTLNEANERAKQIEKRAQEENLTRREQTMEQARSEIIELRDRMLRMAELDQRKALLGVKREVIDEVFTRTLDQMLGMSPEKKRAYNEQIILENAEGGEELVVSSKDAPLYDEAYMSALNAKLSAKGINPGLTLSAERLLEDGGLVLKKRGMEVNCTYRAMLKQMRPSYEVEVAEMLFGGERG